MDPLQASDKQRILQLDPEKLIELMYLQLKQLQFVHRKRLSTCLQIIFKYFVHIALKNTDNKETNKIVTGKRAKEQEDAAWSAGRTKYLNLEMHASGTPPSQRLLQMESIRLWEGVMILNNELPTMEENSITYWSGWQMLVWPYDIYSRWFIQH